MEKTITNTASSLKIHKFVEIFFMCLQALLAYASTRWKVWNKMKDLSATADQTVLSQKVIRERDVKMVMDRLGIDYEIPDGDHKMIQEKIGEDELSELFEDEEPSLEEVKETFCVFDENKDGFIDAKELQRVLRSLGVEEGSEEEECMGMIRAVDENGDGLIDFHEFVKLMEKSLSS